jgi:chromosome segregation ATPase
MECARYEAQIAQEKQFRETFASENDFIDSLFDFSDFGFPQFTVGGKPSRDAKSEQDLLAQLKSLELQILEFEANRPIRTIQSTAAISVSRLTQLEIEKTSHRKSAKEMTVSQLQTMLSRSTERIILLDADVEHLRSKLRQIETDSSAEIFAKSSFVRERQQWESEIAILEQDIDTTARTFDCLEYDIRKLRETGVPIPDDFDGSDDDADAIPPQKAQLQAEVGNLEEKIRWLKEQRSAYELEQRELIRLLYARLRSNEKLIRAYGELTNFKGESSETAAQLVSSDSFELQLSSSGG